MNRVLSIEKLDRYGRVTAETPETPEDGAGCGQAGPRSRSVRMRVTPAEGEPFTISARMVCHFGLTQGGELTDEVYEEIFRSLHSSCMQRCGTLLGNRDYTQSRLRAKLEEAGYPSSIIGECIEKLKEAHYLDDRRFAQSYVRSHLRDRSLLRISHDLKDRGVPDELIEEAFAEAAEELDPEEAQMDQIRRWLHKKRYDPETADYALRQKIMMSLHRKGFEAGLIRRVMDE